MSEKYRFHVKEVPGRWPVEKAKKWMTGFPWLVGANYLPRTAINQLEMFQADTFDPALIDEDNTPASKQWLVVRPS